MVKIFRPVKPNVRETFIQDTAKSVANATGASLHSSVAKMSAAEQRGYLRSRVLREAREQVRQLIAQVRLTEQGEAELTAAVLERAVHLLMRDSTASPIAAIPTPHVRSRAA